MVEQQIEDRTLLSVLSARFRVPFSFYVTLSLLNLPSMKHITPMERRNQNALHLAGSDTVKTCHIHAVELTAKQNSSYSYQRDLDCWERHKMVNLHPIKVLCTSGNRTYDLAYFSCKVSLFLCCMFECTLFSAVLFTSILASWSRHRNPIM